MIVSVTDQFQNNDREENDETIKEFKRLQISNDSTFQQVDNTTKEREISYITGCSGSGKSTYTRKFIEEMRKVKNIMYQYIYVHPYLMMRV